MVVSAEVAMKLWVGFGVFVWLLCGAVGAWMKDDLQLDQWQVIAKGPITLVHAINEHPVTIPTQD
jgi:hypothetical protein